MEIVYLIIGIAAGAAVAWYIAGLRLKQSQVPKTDFDAVQARLTEAETSLRVEAERAASLREQLTAAEGSLREKEARVVGLLQELATASAQLDAARQSLAASEESVGKLRADADARTDTVIALKAQAADLEARNAALDEKLATQKAEIENLGKRFEAEFRNLATTILEEKSERFTALNRANLDAILAPLGENIEAFRRKVQEVYDLESKERFSLGKEVEKLVAMNQQISEDATNLTRALEGSSKTQGDWGEMILERVLEQSGLERGREYLVQETLRDADGSTLKGEGGSTMRPDVVVLYPDNRRVIIDSKVSLVAYTRYSAAASPGEEAAALEQHVDSIKRHVDALSAKNYQDFTASLDYVMMFIPIEPAFLVALRHDPELWYYAYRKRVVLISPTNLIPVLKIVADLWHRFQQDRNAVAIAETGGALYDKFVGFVDTLQDVGAHIGKAHVSFDTAMKQMQDGKGNLISRVEKLKALGAKAKKSLPSAMTDAALGEDDTPELDASVEEDGGEHETGSGDA